MAPPLSSTKMSGSSPVLYMPQTPHVSRTKDYSALTKRPTKSSPLASSPLSSPVTDAQARRRRSQYKSFGSVNVSVPSSLTSRRPSSSAAKPMRAIPLFSSPENDQKAFMRERFKKRCFDRLNRAREHALKKKRFGEELSSDGFDDAMDEDDDKEETDDDIMQDEFFRRLMASANHQQKHRYLVSYENEVGSFDPDMEDVSNWESEFLDSGVSSSATDEVPPDVDEDAIAAAYAEEYAAIADLEDIPEDFFDDDDDLLRELETDNHTPVPSQQTRDEDIDMTS